MTLKYVSGGQGRDYNGHLFWDTEMYILPAMVLTHPDMVKYILRYRSAFAQEAKDLAEAMGHEGTNCKSCTTLYAVANQ